MRAITASPAAEPVRLDVFLARQVPHCSRRIAQRAIAAGEVRINRRRARKGDLVTANDTVEVADALFVPPALQPNPRLPVRVLYEDAALIAVDKPAGMPSHALRAQETATVANFLLALHPELATVGKTDREAGIVHRLDTDTSGVLLAARTPSAYHTLREQFSRQEVTKEYVALVEGEITAPGVVRTPIMHKPHNRRLMQVCSTPDLDRHARPAVTHFQPLEHFAGVTMLRIRIPTGVMHQIRVHLVSIGHPVIGDRLYGKPSEMAPRQLLHAAQLALAHPESGEPLRLSSPLPADFADVLERLRSARRSTGRSQAVSRSNSKPRGS